MRPPRPEGGGGSGVVGDGMPEIVDVSPLEEEEINLLRESVMDTTVTLAAAAAAAEAEAWSDRRRRD